MERGEILAQAGDLINGSRAAVYGDAHEMWVRIAAIWSVRTGAEISPALACSMMANVKQVRSDLGSFQPDNAVDAVGYEAIAGEIAGCLEGTHPAPPAESKPGVDDEPEPQAEVEPEPAPTPDQELPTVAKPEAVPPPDWDALCSRIAAGERIKDVAQGAGVKWTVLRSRYAQWKQKHREQVVPPPCPKLEPSKIHPDEADTYGWTPREDLALLEAFAAGKNPVDIAEGMAGRSSGMVAARFRKLVPSPGIDAQRKAIERLRRVVGGVPAVAAE